MGRKGCVPKCKQGYAGVPKDPNVTVHLFKEEWRLKIHRGSKWKVTENTFICSKHFVASDFIIESRDSNKRRRKKKGTELDFRKIVYAQLYSQTVPVIYLERSLLSDQHEHRHHRHGRN